MSLTESNAPHLYDVFSRVHSEWYEDFQQYQPTPRISSYSLYSTPSLLEGYFSGDVGPSRSTSSDSPYARMEVTHFSAP